MKEHEAVLHELDYVPYFEEIAVEIPEGEVDGRPDARRLAPAHPQARTAITTRPAAWEP